MIRNFKILGIALAAMVATGALAASMTQATDDTPELTAGKSTTAAKQNIEMSGLGEKESAHAFGWTTSCEKTVYGPSMNAVPSSSFTLKPVWKDCKTSSGMVELSATVITNECGFRFNIGATTKDGQGQPISHTYNGTLDIECKAPGEAIEVKVWTDVESHEEGTEKTPLCVVKVTAQTQRPGVTLKVNTGTPHSIQVSGTAKNVHAHQVRNHPACPSGTTTGEGQYTFGSSGFKVEAFNAGGFLDAWID